MNTQAQISSSAVVSPGATPTAAPKGWFSRNWKWLVPTLVMFFFILPLAFLGSIFAAMPATGQAGVIQTQETQPGGRSRTHRMPAEGRCPHHKSSIPQHLK